MRIQPTLAVLFALLVLAFGSCAEPGPTENIVEIASANNEVSTLVTAIQAAGLEGTLSGEGPYTVFAPNNSAFEDLPDGLLDALLQPENQQTLSQILTYHVVEGKMDAAAVTQAIQEGGGSAALTTVGGGTLTATIDNEVVILTDAQGNAARVLATDMKASNGVIHLISAVMLPQGVDPAALLPAADIVSVAMSNEQFSTLVTAVQAAGLVETLQQPGPYTIFAPTNAAFEQLPEGTVETLLQPDNQSTLQGILTYHVVAGSVSAEDLLQAISDNGGSYTISTVNGASLTASLSGNNVILTDAAGNQATVVSTDIAGSNGLIHVIDKVVMPE